ncbi:MAG: glucose-6-phosphate isomerase [Brevinematales bacterium]|nr:glucose-6-phosphate isomerase [Brevinematales bacterium]
MGIFKFDYNYCLSNYIGSRVGISEDELSSYEKKIKKLHENLMIKSQRDLGFYNLPYDEENLKDIKERLKKFKDRFDTQVVLGIGGSGLGPAALQSSILNYISNELPKEKRGGMKTYIIDNVDPDWFSDIMEVIDPNKTVFVVISKSGSTAETAAGFLACFSMFKSVLGSRMREHVIAVTDSQKGELRKMVNEFSLESFSIPENVGGRFSVLSSVGLVPGELMGIDIDKLLEGAREMDKVSKNPELFRNPAYLNAVIEYIFYLRGINISVLMPYSTKLSKWSDWYVQLWAESLGKKVDVDGAYVYVGPTPLRAVGATDQHSQVQLFKEGPYDKVITFIRVEKFNNEVKLEYDDSLSKYSSMGYLMGHTMNELIDAEEKSTEAALAKEGKPSKTIILPKVDEYYIGQMIFFFEVSTAMSGELYNINAFDQPGVEEGKNFTYALLGRKGYEEKKKEFEKLYNKSSKYII